MNICEWFSIQGVFSQLSSICSKILLSFLTPLFCSYPTFVSKFYHLYLQNISRILSILTSPTATPGLSHTNISLKVCDNLLAGLFASTPTPLAVYSQYVAREYYSSIYQILSLCWKPSNCFQAYSDESQTLYHGLLGKSSRSGSLPVNILYIMTSSLYRLLPNPHFLSFCHTDFLVFLEHPRHILNLDVFLPWMLLSFPISSWLDSSLLQVCTQKLYSSWYLMPSLDTIT